MHDEWSKPLQVEMFAASLRANSTDIKAFLEALAVKLEGSLPGQTLVTSEHSPVVHAAYEQCVNVLMSQLKEYKDRLGNVPERQKAAGGTRQGVAPKRPRAEPPRGTGGGK